MHGSAPGHGETVAKHVYHIDITRTLGNAFLQNPGCLVDHRISQSFDYFNVTDLTSYDTLGSSLLPDDFHHYGVIYTGTGSGVVFVVAGPGFLTISPHLNQGIGDTVRAGIPFFLVTQCLACLGTIFKLLVMPVMAYLVGRYVFDLPLQWLGVVTLFAALPAGLIPYTFALKEKLAPRRVASMILISITLAPITLFIAMWFLGVGGQ